LNATLITAVASFAAAGFGSYFAFLLQNRKEQRNELNQQRKAVNRAIFNLSHLWNAQNQYYKEVILPDKNSPALWLRMQANISTQFLNISFDIDGLFFLADTDHAQFLSRFYLEEQRFEVVKDLIQERSSVVLNQLYPKMEHLGVRAGKPFELQTVERELGPDLVGKLKTLTEEIVTNIEQNIESTKCLNQEFHEAMAGFFKKRTLFFFKRKYRILKLIYDEYGK
jgi:hypothetical protein